MATTGEPVLDGTTTNDQAALDDLDTKTNGNSVPVIVQEIESLSIGDTNHTRTNTKRSKLPYEEPLLPLIDRYIDEPRPLRVAVIGGGMTGILAGILLPSKVPGIILTIYDKNSDFVSWLTENEAHDQMANQPAITRVAPGQKTSTPAFDAIYRLTCTNAPLHPRKTGAMSSRSDMRSSRTGAASLEITTCTATPS